MLYDISYTDADKKAGNLNMFFLKQIIIRMKTSDQKSKVVKSAPVKKPVGGKVKLSQNAAKPNAKVKTPATSKLTSPVPKLNIKTVKSKKSDNSLSVAIQSANAIASNRSHPNQSQVSELLRTHEKGWIDGNKFMEILKSLAF